MERRELTKVIRLEFHCFWRFMPDIAFIRGVTRGHILHTRWICIRVWKSRLQRKVLWFPLKAGKRFGISGSKSKESKENRRKRIEVHFSFFANFTTYGTLLGKLHYNISKNFTTALTTSPSRSCCTQCPAPSIHVVPR